MKISAISVPVRLVKMKQTKPNNDGDTKQKEQPIITGGKAIWFSPFGAHWQFLAKLDTDIHRNQQSHFNIFIQVNQKLMLT
jgi:hypothetical protein